MKQKYLEDGSIHVEFSYKGKFYCEVFNSSKELNQFLETL